MTPELVFISPFFSLLPFSSILRGLVVWPQGQTQEKGRSRRVKDKKSHSDSRCNPFFLICLLDKFDQLNFSRDAGGRGEGRANPNRLLMK